MRLIDADALRNIFAGQPPEYYTTGYLIGLIDRLPTVSGWVNVKDRLPDKHCNCLVFNKHGWLALDRWEGYGWMLSDDPEVTHWMPFPKPPKEDD